MSRDGVYQHMHREHTELPIAQRPHHIEDTEHCILSARCVRPNSYPGECRNQYRH